MKKEHYKELGNMGWTGNMEYSMIFYAKIYKNSWEKENIACKIHNCSMDFYEKIGKII